MTRVLCVADSMGLSSEGLAYKDMWFYKMEIKYRDCEFIDSLKRSLLSTDLGAYLDDYLRLYRHNVLVLQTGICACSPRMINAIHGWR